ncbi:MAG: ribosome biogenesis GTP-binding protein YihA/YsxC [Saprospiraceae bacterium]|nr:ribosome biogenesis GTP-binding protein YihA/YsxC [Saprospiraceae bacterium]
MIIHSAEYTGSYPSEAACPKDGRVEFAFIGRSNVGKSSLINLITARKGLALTSGTPGKTQTINFFSINEEWYLVDLPGYGYARTSKVNRRKWETMIQGYLMRRGSLACTFILLDANIPPQLIDIEFINWMGEKRLPFVIVYTKTDRMKDFQRDENIARIRAALLEHWNELPQEFITSAVKHAGGAELLAFIEQVRRRIDV